LPYHRTITTRPNQTTWGRFRDTLRSYTIGLPPLRDPALAKYFDGGGATSAGVAVSEQTALNYAAVWQAVSLIAGDVGSLPLPLYKRLKTGGKERYPEHPLYYILHDAPNPEMSSMVWRETLQGHLLTWGNCYSEIVRNGAGQVSEIWPMLPSQVSPFRQDGRLKYRIVPDSGREVILESFDVVHVPGLGFDGTIGYSPIHKARESLGLLAASERFGATFFGNGTAFGGFISHPKTLSEKAEKSLRESINSQHQGPDKAHRIKLLEEGMTFQQTGIEPNAAQFLETRQFQIAEVARWFNLPLHKLREMEHSSVRANIEQEALDYVTSTLRPWLKRWEQEINRKLISPREKYQQSAEFVIEGLLRGDIASRYSAYSVGRQWGWLSVNEVRELENLNPIPDGNTYLSPMNMTPADRLNEVIDAQIKPKPAPAQAQPADKPEDDGERQALRAQVLQQVEIIQKLQAADEAARTSLEALRQDADNLSSALDAAISDAAGERQSYLSEVEAREKAEADVSAVSFRLAAAEAANEQARTEIGALKAETEQREAQSLDAALTAKAADEAARASLRAELDRTQAELEDVRAVWNRIATEASESQAALLAITHERDTSNERLVEESRAANAAELRADKAEATIQQMADDFAALATRCEAQDKALEEARADRALAIRHRDEETETGAQAEQARDEAIANAAALSVTAEAADMRAQVAEARALQADIALSTEREARAAMLTSLITANRGVLIDAVGRMVRREAEAARRKRATPAKLREWAGTFYEEHELDLWSQALAPAIGVHLALCGKSDDAGQIARELAAAHMAASQHQIVAVAASDPDDYQRALDVTLTRWETARAETTVDALLRQEIAHVRSI
jgi:HK97 family phage portal protein